MGKKYTKDDWNSLAKKELREKKISEIEWKTPEGINVKPLYTEEDVKNLEHSNQSTLHGH